jgi:hypothetical protein
LRIYLDFYPNLWFINSSLAKECAMSDLPSAQIIPFPLRAPAPPSDDGADRLARALASLDAALNEQRSAIAGWRGALADLQTTMQSLGASAQQCHDNLGKLGENVAGLNAQARQLEAWADGVLADEVVAAERLSPEPSR